MMEREMSTKSMLLALVLATASAAAGVATIAPDKHQEGPPNPG
jgi:hypothetical protein